ncbi:hypothetical protein ACS0TY_011271 [Phlomoides rotata]
MLSRDPHVVRLMDVKQGQNKEGKTVLYLVFEYMDTDLKKYIRSFRQNGHHVPPGIVKSLMFQFCKGVTFCHGHGVLHRKFNRSIKDISTCCLLLNHMKL